jgi:hypothetical protein
MDIITADKIKELEDRLAKVEQDIKNLTQSLQPSIHRKLGGGSALGSPANKRRGFHPWPE